METFSIILNCIERHLGLILTFLGVIITLFIYFKQVKSRTIKKLSKQIIAYYSLEQVAIMEIQKATNENLKTIKTRLRKCAQEHQENLEKEYPSFTAKEARKYL